MRHAFYRDVQIGVGVDNDRVLAAHFKNRALDPDLSRGLGGRALIDVESDFARSCERNVARLGMSHDGVSKTSARTGAEIDHPLRHSGLFQKFDELRGDGRRVARRLQDHSIPANNRRQSHSRHDRARKIPRRNHGADPQRNIEKPVAFTRQLDYRLRFRKAQRFAAVQFTEIDGLGNVAVGLGPVLADLKNQPRHEFELALAQQVANPKYEAGTFLNGGPTP